MANYTTINKSSEHFNTKLYNGTGSSNAITNVGFEPSLTWIKRRNSATAHHLHNAISGATKVLNSNTNNAESTDAQKLSSFDSDGFTVGTNGDANNSSGTFASWNWKANGSSTVTNNDGANTSYISHNSTAQFSIIKYTGTGSNTNIGHGLNGKPDCFITKGTSGATDWHLWNNSFSANDRIKINSTGAKSSNTSIFPTLPDATKIYLGGGGDVNQSGIEYICYAWKNVTGYSKFGSYDGNGNADGNFVYTGFKPSWIMFKRYDSAGEWLIYDNKRDPHNLVDTRLEAQDNFADSTSSSKSLDFLSNGFKIRSDDGDINTNGGDYLYMAFGQSLVGSNNIPCTAR